MAEQRGATKPTSIEQEESVVLAGVRAKRVLLSGWNGSAINDANVDSGGKLLVVSHPYTYEISEGSVANHKTWSKIGIHLGIGATELDMRPYAAATAGIGWSYTFPTTELTMTIVSDSAEDNQGGAGTHTGAWTITVYYLNAAFEEKTKVCTMNGTGAVTIGTDVYRVNNARVTTTGTACIAVGNITIASGGQTYGFITAGKTRMRQCIWTVPLNKTLYVTQIAFSCSDQSAGKYVRFTTRANFDDKSGTVLQRGLFMPYNEVTLNNTAYFRELNPPTKLAATTDLKVSAISNSAAAGTCALRGWTE
jgi:hypothetical protein